MPRTGMQVTVTHPGGWNHGQEILFFEKNLISYLAKNMIGQVEYKRFFHNHLGSQAVCAAANWLHLELPQRKDFAYVVETMWSGSGLALNGLLTDMVYNVPEIAAFNDPIECLIKPGDDQSHHWLDLGALSRNILNDMIYQSQL